MFNFLKKKKEEVKIIDPSAIDKTISNSAWDLEHKISGYFHDYLYDMAFKNTKKRNKYNLEHVTEEEILDALLYFDRDEFFKYIFVKDPFLMKG